MFLGLDSWTTGGFITGSTIVCVLSGIVYYAT